MSALSSALSSNSLYTFAANCSSRRQNLAVQIMFRFSWCTGHDMAWHIHTRNFDIFKLCFTKIDKPMCWSLWLFYHLHILHSKVLSITYLLPLWCEQNCFWEYWLAKNEQLLPQNWDLITTCDIKICEKTWLYVYCYYTCIIEIC